MVYLDTSAAVPLFVPEPASDVIAMWMEANEVPLVSSDWILTEFSSALSIKVRRNEITTRQAKAAWGDFKEFCRSGLRLVPVSRAAFDSAAELAMNPKSGLRSGDALHLAMAEDLGVDAVLTADQGLARNAKALGIIVVEF